MIRLEDAERYFIPRIQKEEQNIRDYRSRLIVGEDMKVAIASAQKRIEDYKEEWAKRKKQLELKRVVYVQGPELLNCAIILLET